jgi:hypothetical protein
MTDYFAINCPGSADITPASTILYDFFLDCTGALTGSRRIIPCGGFAPSWIAF